MEIYFSNVFGIVRIFASSKIFEKPLTFECLFFLILFPYYENSLLICFGNCMVSVSPEIFKKSVNLKYLSFTVLFPYYGNPLFPCLGNCMDFCFKRKILKNPWLWNACVFSNFSLTTRIHFSHVLEIVWINSDSHVFGIAWVSISREIEECANM